jgi:hypothetical protein
VFRLYKLGTIWHVEPGGRDAFTVCNRTSQWKWHVHHWRVQVFPLQKLRATLFNRCELCGRRGRPNVSHQWHTESVGWRFWRTPKGLYHAECSSLIHERRATESSETLIRHLFAAYRVHVDMSERDLLDALTHAKARGLSFHESHRLTRVLGYERDDDYVLVKKGGQS